MNCYTRAKEVVIRGWTQGAYARDGNGEPCPIMIMRNGTEEPRESCHCLVGAIRQVAFALKRPDLYQMMLVDVTLILRELYGYKSGPIAWNDEPDRLKHEVVQLLTHLELLENERIKQDAEKSEQ